jgi:hypothetical protein
MPPIPARSRWYSPGPDVGAVIGSGRARATAASAGEGSDGDKSSHDQDEVGEPSAQSLGG